MIHRDFNLSDYNTFRLPCIAQFSRQILSLSDLDEFRRFSLECSLPLLPLGQGSNIILPEKIASCVALMKCSRCCLVTQEQTIDVLKLNNIQDEAVILKISAGYNWHELVTWTLSQGYYGLENLALIPGTAGAAPVQNIGAYGVELSDLCCGVEVMDIRSGNISIMTAKACDFGYRDSIFKRQMKSKVVITALFLKLSYQFIKKTTYKPLAEAVDSWERLSGQTVTAKKIFELIVNIRKQKLPDPKLIGNVGSFFKNPIIDIKTAVGLQKHYPDMPMFFLSDKNVKLAAGWLIEQCGLKGRSFSGVAVYEKQALVLVNTKSATYQAVISLVKKIKKAVYARFKVQLVVEPEIIHYTS